MLSLLKRFTRKDDAAVAFEAVIMTPILAFMFVASFVFFDAFRTYNTSVKATYAVADVISRQGEADVYESDIRGLANIFQHITRNPNGSAIRVTQMIYDADTDDNSFAGTYATNGRTELRASDIPDMRDRIPVMSDGDAVLIVESLIPYRPAFDVGLGALEFSNFTTTRPRVGRIPFNDGDDPACVSCNWGETPDLGDGDTTGSPTNS